MVNQQLWILIFSGIVAGMITLVLTRKLLVQRQPGLALSWWANITWPNLLLWSLLGVGIVTLATLRSDSLPTTIIRSVWFFSLLSLSTIDQAIRKIPNEALFLMIIAKIAEIIIRRDLALIPPALIGLVAGYVFFSIPAFLGRSIGKGDVKLAAVISCCIGIIGMLQSVIVMSLGIVIYFLVKLKYKRGSLKTKVAIGPYLSIGMVVSVLFPISVALSQ